MNIGNRVTIPQRPLPRTQACIGECVNLPRMLQTLAPHRMHRCRYEGQPGHRLPLPFGVIGQQPSLWEASREVE